MSYQRRKTISLNTPSSFFKVIVTKTPDMNVEYSDLVFVKDANSQNADDRKFLDFEFEEKNATQAKIWIRSDTAISSVDLLYKGTNAVSKATRNAFIKSGNYINKFTDIWRDVIKVNAGYDQGICMDSGRYQSWPSSVITPLTNTPCFVFRDSGTNSHSATADGTIRFKKIIGTQSNGLPIWSQDYIVADPPGNWGGMNAQVLATVDGGNEILICVYNVGVANGTVEDAELYDRMFAAKSTDLGETWTPLNGGNFVGPDHYSHVGGQATRLSNGWLLFGFHFDSSPTKKTGIVYTKDNGVTWLSFEIDSPSGRYLNETCYEEITPTQIRCTSRDENSPYKFHKWFINIDGSGNLSATTPEINDFWDTVQNRVNFCKTPDGRTYYFYGTTYMKVSYTDDHVSFYNLDHTIANGALQGSMRLYPAPFYWNDKVYIIWNNNVLSGGSDIYLSFFDPALMNLRTVNEYAYNQDNPRPEKTATGIKINADYAGSQVDRILVSNYRRNGYTNPFRLIGITDSSGYSICAPALVNTSLSPDNPLSACSLVHGLSNKFYCTVSNDGWNTAINNPDGVKAVWWIDWSPAEVKIYKDGVLLGSKLPGNGSGIPNYDARIELFLRTNSTYQTGSLGCDLLAVVPHPDSWPTEITQGQENSGLWDEDENGIVLSDPPTTPPNLEVSKASSTENISLTWGASTAAEFYRIYRSTSPISNGSLLLTTQSLSCIDETAVPGTVYYYRILATNSAGESPISNPEIGIRADIPEAPPAAIYPYIIIRQYASENGVDPGELLHEQVIDTQA